MKHTLNEDNYSLKFIGSICALLGGFILVGSIEANSLCESQLNRLTESQIEQLESCTTDVECRYEVKQLGLSPDCFE